jgi:hypothetical protein
LIIWSWLVVVGVETTLAAVVVRVVLERVRDYL